MADWYPRNQQRQPRAYEPATLPYQQKSMNPDHQLEDTTEVVTEDEFRDVCSQSSPRSYWGVAPTGPPHLGYYRMIEKQQALLEHGFDHTVLLADLHAYLDDEKCPWEEMDRRAGVYQTVFELLGLDDASFVVSRCKCDRILSDPTYRTSPTGLAVLGSTLGLAATPH